MEIWASVAGEEYLCGWGWGVGLFGAGGLAGRFCAQWGFLELLIETRRSGEVQQSAVCEIQELEENDS